MRSILLLLLIAPTLAYGGDANRLIKTMPDGGRIYSKHSLVGQCKISDGTVLLCASSNVNDDFGLKYDGYWFNDADEKLLYGTKKNVIKFTESATAKCAGLLSKQDDGGLFVGPPSKNADFSTACSISKAESRRVTTICTIGQRCTVFGYILNTCEGECSVVTYATSIRNR